MTGTKPLTPVANDAMASDKIINMSVVFLIQMGFLATISVVGCQSWILQRNPL